MWVNTTMSNKLYDVRCQIKERTPKVSDEKRIEFEKKEKYA